MRQKPSGFTIARPSRLRLRSGYNRPHRPLQPRAPKPKKPLKRQNPTRF
jgi:hypothetical protein